MAQKNHKSNHKLQSVRISERTVNQAKAQRLTRGAENDAETPSKALTMRWSTHHHIWRYTWALGIQNHILVLVKQAIDPPIHLPRPFYSIGHNCTSFIGLVRLGLVYWNRVFIAQAGLKLTMQLDKFKDKFELLVLQALLPNCWDYGTEPSP